LNQLHLKIGVQGFHNTGNPQCDVANIDDAGGHTEFVAAHASQ